MKKPLSLIALALMSCSMIEVGPAGGTEKIRFAYISDSPGSSAPYWIAQEAGLFKKYGLDAELLFINGSTRGVQSLVAGELDFVGAVGTSAINGKLAGGDLWIVNGLVNTLPYYIIGSAKIQSPEDLKGRTLATHVPGTAADFAVRLALKKYGIGYNDIRAVMVGGAPARVAAVINGQTDFTMVTDSGKIKGEKAGLKVLVDMAKLKIPFQFTCTVASGKTIRERPKIVEAMAKAVAEAVHFFKTQKQETIKIMAKYTRGADAAVLLGSWDAHTELLEDETLPTLPGLNDTLAVQAGWDKKALGAKAEDFVDLRFVHNLQQRGFFDKLRSSAGLTQR